MLKIGLRYNDFAPLSKTISGGGALGAFAIRAISASVDFSPWLRAWLYKVKDGVSSNVNFPLGVGLRNILPLETTRRYIAVCHQNGFTWLYIPHKIVDNALSYAHF